MNSVVFGQDNGAGASAAFSLFSFYYYYAFLKPAESGVLGLT
jgi:hypothetical protein